MDFFKTEDSLTYAIFDIKEQLTEISFLNILLTTFILMIFALGSWYEQGTLSNLDLLN